MTDLNKAVYDYLIADSAVSALVGTRIRPDALDDDDTMPAVLFYRTTGVHETRIDGSTAGLAETRLEVHCFANTRKQANEVAEAVRLAMIDFAGIRSGVNIRTSVVDTGQMQSVDNPVGGTEVYRYVTSQDFRIFFIEDV